MYRPAEVAQRLHIHLSTVYRRIEDGTIPAVRIGRVLRIPSEEFERRFGAGVTNADAPPQGSA